MSNQITNTNQNAQNTCQGKCPDTLCWNCRYATGLQFEKPLAVKSRKTGATRRIERCPWIEYSKPVPGWKAEKTTIKNPEIWGGKLESYCVIECPCFKESKRKEATIEEIIEVFEFPVRYALSNRLTLFDFYDVYLIMMAEAKKMYGSELTSEQHLKIKIAAVRGYVEDLEFDLDCGHITNEEYEQKLNIVEVLEKTIKDYHDHAKRVAEKKAQQELEKLARLAKREEREAKKAEKLMVQAKV